MAVKDIKITSFSDLVNPKIVTSSGVKYYGVDNMLPNNIEQLISRSPTAKKCVTEIISTLERLFIDNLKSKNVNVENLDLLNLNGIFQDIARFNGFALFHNLNYKGEVTSSERIPFSSVRYSSDYINSGKLLISDNWNNGFCRYFHVFDLKKLNKKNIKEMILNKELIGAVSYTSFHDGQVYPEPNGFSSIPSMTAELQSQIENESSFADNFTLRHILINKTEMRDEEENEKRAKEMENNLIGATGKQVALVTIDGAGGEGNNPLEVIKIGEKSGNPELQTRYLFQREEIISSFGIPLELILSNTSGLFSNDKILEKATLKLEQNLRMTLLKVVKYTEGFLWNY